ncbi:arylesterase [Massilia sp. W12]|uniref:arylesterase n=1 Tax=Massilia sp. W12 TaxID=3126507 RepID=UPI0030CF00EA
MPYYPMMIKFFHVCFGLLLLAAGRDGYCATKNLLVLGDSLSAEYGIARGSGWVAQLQARLQKSHPEYQVINASVSGETSSGGKSRLPALLKQHQPAIVIIELGGNDGLRGLPVAALSANLQSMVKDSKAAGARVLLAGMQIPPNYGQQYTQKFYAAFATVAQQEKVALLPFLLKGVAENEDLFQADRIHPKQEAHAQILENIWPVLSPLLKNTKAK